MNTNQKSHQQPIGDSLMTEVNSSPPPLISVNYLDITMNQPDTATDFASIPAPIRALTETSTASREKPALSPAPIKTLTDKHRQEICVDSCIDAVQATAFESVEDPERIKVLLNDPKSIHQSGWIAHSCDPNTGDLDPEKECFKPDVPRLGPKSKPIKYENRRKLNSTENNPPIFLLQPDKNYWPNVVADRNEPLCFTEGAKCAASLMSNYPLATVALRGINCFTKKKEDSNDPIELHQYILDLGLAGRLVYIAFDADWQTKPQVAFALSRLEKLLSDQGAIVKILVWSIEQGKGIDDFIKNGGNVSNLIINAKMANQPQISVLLPPPPVEMPDEFGLLQHEVLKAFKQQNGDNYLLDSQTETFYEKNGVELVKVRDNVIKKIIHRLLENVKVTVKRDDGSTYTRYSICNTTRKVTDSFTYLKTELDGEYKFKDDINRLAFTNGVLDLRTMQLSPYKYDDFFLVNFPYPFHPQTECPSQLLKFINTSFGDDQVEKIRAIIRYLLDSSFWGYFVHVMGDAGSGKGTLLNIITALFPDSAVVHNNNLGIITQEDKRYQYLVGGRRIFKVDDCPGFNQAPQDLYSLTENSPLSCRKLHSSDAAIGVKFNTKFLLASVGAITTSSDGRDGWARRVLMIKTLPVQQQIRGEKKQYKGDIEAEILPCIAEITGWALAMSKDEMKVQIELIQSGKLNKELQFNQDPMAQFIDVGLTSTTEDSMLPETDLIECFKAYAYVEGIKLGTKKARELAQAHLRKRFVPAHTERKKGVAKPVKVNNQYKGIKLVDNAFLTVINFDSKRSIYHFYPEHASFGGYEELTGQTRAVDQIEPVDQTEPVDQPNLVEQPDPVDQVDRVDQVNQPTVEQTTKPFQPAQNPHPEAESKPDSPGLLARRAEKELEDKLALQAEIDREFLPENELIVPILTNIRQPFANPYPKPANPYEEILYDPNLDQYNPILPR